MDGKIVDSSNMRPQVFSNLFKQAMKTFLPQNAENFQGSFSKLKEHMDKIRAADLGLDDAYFNNFVINKKSDAPCTYIEIFEDDNINMSVFILKPDFTMPLHDHPRMHGLLKVVWGTARVKTFSQIDDKNQIERLRASLTPQWRDPRFNRSIFSRLMDDKMCDEQSESCILTPQQSNFHQITSVGGYAAFLDILSPPYSSHNYDTEEEIDEEQIRDCHYFEVDHDFGERVFHLSETPPPTSFYCYQGPYTGPELPQTHNN